ncbi:MAG: LacI family DNA-binding transcriptional regulator [Woeseiaceae bacterium]
MSKNKVTIKEVAAAANVHPSTVSRVLNPSTRSMVSEDVAQRVLNIASDLGYARSAIASGLRTGRSYTVGVIIPDLSNPVFPPVVRGIERALSAAGYIALLADSDNSPQSERAIFDSLRARSIDGLILATAHTEDPVVMACVDAQMPLVLVNRTVAAHDVTEVINNDEMGIELAIEHLVELGHHDIAFLGGPEDTTTGRDRRRAFEHLGNAGQFVLDMDLLVSCNAFTEAAGAIGMQRILQSGKRFTAVVAANDLLALGCYDALASAGLSCPGDVSVTGFNDMRFVDRLSPPLTSVHIQHDELGVRAAALLLEEIRNPDAARQTVRLDPELIVRESTAPPPT